ncbi:MAG: helix-turn-helix transcriptional regulator [Gemmatimonadota bacterium]|jgi:DNA-binding PadR family transcriptional regulator
MASTEIQGEFEHRVLLATLRLGAMAFTSSIVLELEQRTGREVAAAAVYVALRRLESKGLVSSTLRRGDEAGQLRARRFFAITASGVAALRESRAELGRLWEGYESVLSEG